MPESVSVRVYYRDRPQYREYEIHRLDHHHDCAPRSYNFNSPQTVESVEQFKAEIKQTDPSADVRIARCCE
jgi:hypothetical protein